jgi:YegS/Rv2252/BmrU family lipid kinase
VVSTSSPERSAIDLARSAALAGAERVVAVGGDGTVHEVLQGLLGVPADRRPIFGLVPAGTANDFAALFDGGPDLAGWLRHALLSEPRLVDLGLADGVPFANTATIGVPAEVSADTPTELKATLGKLAYTVHALAVAGAAHPFGVSVSGPGFSFEGEAVAVCVCNGRQAGGGFVLAPDAELDDGLLDVLIVPRMGIAGLGDALARGPQRGAAAHLPRRGGRAAGPRPHRGRAPGDPPGRASRAGARRDLSQLPSRVRQVWIKVAKSSIQRIIHSTNTRTK